jgi:hypothetical protein
LEPRLLDANNQRVGMRWRPVRAGWLPMLIEACRRGASHDAKADPADGRRRRAVSPADILRYE